MFRVSVGRGFGVTRAIAVPANAMSNPKLQIPNPNHSQSPNPRLLIGATEGVRLAVGSWEFVGMWQLGVVGIWSVELGS
jgi:hypothetical protein